MTRKLKFKPEIRRVKLNPEQAVLECSCYDQGRMEGGGWMYWTPNVPLVYNHCAPQAEWGKKTNRPAVPPWLQLPSEAAWECGGGMYRKGEGSSPAS